MTIQKKQVSNLVDQYGQPIFAGGSAGPRHRRRIDNFYTNPGTGLGMPGADRTLGNYSRPGYMGDQESEDLYYGSALAANAVNFPVEDALMRWRTFEGDAAEQFKEVEKKYEVKDKLSKAAKDGRVYGTALLLMRLADDEWSQPLNMDAIRPGVLKGLTVVDRRAISNVNIDTDLMSENYGKAYSYDITFPRNYQTLRIHASRTLRFDGVIPNSPRDFYRNNSRWGLGTSIFIRLAEQLEMLAVSLQSLAHLETEAGMPVLGLQGYEDIIAQIDAGSGEGTALNKLREIQNNRSVYNMTIMSAEDLYQRLDVNFAGRPQLLQEYKSMLSAATGIPITRLFGQSPGGLNATGESDERNYAVKISEIQETVYAPVLEIMDMVLARAAGMMEPPKYTWNPLLDLSDTEQVGNRKVEMETLLAANGGKPIMSMQETRYQFSTMPAMEWLNQGDIPEELLAPPPKEESGGAEAAYLPGGGGGMPALGPPGIPPGPGPVGAPGEPPEFMDDGMGFAEGDFRDIPPEEGAELSDDEIVAAAVADELLGGPTLGQRLSHRDYAE